MSEQKMKLTFLTLLLLVQGVRITHQRSDHYVKLRQGKGLETYENHTVTNLVRCAALCSHGYCEAYSYKPQGPENCLLHYSGSIEQTTDDSEFTFYACTYRLKSIAKTWHDAEQICQDTFSGHLATISDRYLQSHMENDKLIFSDTPAWIGLFGRQNEHYWRNGKLLKSTNYQNWFANFPQPISDDCVNAYAAEVQDKDFGRWKNSKCGEELPYVCELNTLRYKAYKEKLSYDEAGEVCRQKQNWDLAIIESEEDNLEVLAAMDLNGDGRDAYIGLKRVGAAREFEWANGKKLKDTGYSNWRKGEPTGTNGDNEENCVEMSWTGEWNDVICEWTFSHVCQLHYP